MAREDVNIKVSANIAEAIQMWKAMEQGPEGMARAMEGMAQRGGKAKKDLAFHAEGLIGKWVTIGAVVKKAHDALKAMWRFVKKANSYVEEVAPWALAKDEAQRARLEAVLYHLADSLRLIALTAFPVCPRAAQSLWERLGLPGQVGDHTFPEAGRFGLLPGGARITVGDPLFPRIEEESAQPAT